MAAYLFLMEQLVSKHWDVYDDKESARKTGYKIPLVKGSNMCNWLSQVHLGGGGVDLRCGYALPEPLWAKHLTPLRL